MAEIGAARASLEAPSVAAASGEGLGPAEAAGLLAGYGPNELPSPRRDPWALRLARQFAEPMALLLLAAAAVSALALGERVDGAAIVAIVVLNAAIGLVEEGRAARALEALRRMETPTATVVRGGTGPEGATIVTAVREGRGIYDSIRKVVDHLVAGNLSEIMVVVASLLAFPALGIPLLPLQLLWINLLTDGLPAIALGVDPVDPSLMARPPRSPGSRLLSARRLRILAGRAVLIAAAAVGAAAITRYALGEPWEQTPTVMFSVLVGAHLLYAFVARRPDPVAAPTTGATPGRPAGGRGSLVDLGLCALPGVARLAVA
jgi:magnesium-transporting ATPase (P-type)